MNDMKIGSSDAYISKNFDLKEYDKLMTSTNDYMNMINIIIKIIEPAYEKNNKLRILEIGAGTGLFTKKLLFVLKEAKITVIEPDNECCKKLHEQIGERIKIIQSDGESFKKGEYDIIIMSESFHHIKYENKEFLIKNILQMLVESGLFVIGDFFIPEFETEEERKESLKKCFLPWIEELRKKGNKNQEDMARKTLELALSKSGEYHLSPAKFEDIMKTSGFGLLRKINVSKTPIEKEGANIIYVFLNKQNYSE